LEAFNLLTRILEDQFTSLIWEGKKDAAENLLAEPQNLTATEKIREAALWRIAIDRLDHVAKMLQEDSESQPDKNLFILKAEI
jgi:hypothetical protein